MRAQSGDAELDDAMRQQQQTERSGARRAGAAQGRPRSQRRAQRRRSSSPSDLPPPLPPLPPSLTATAAAAEAAEAASECVVCEAPEAPAEAEAPAEGAPRSDVRSAADPHLPSPLPPLPPSLIEEAATAAAVVCEAPKAPAEAEAPAEDTECLEDTDYFGSSSDSEEEEDWEIEWRRDSTIRTMGDNKLFTVFLAAAKEIRSRGFDPKRFVVTNTVVTSTAVSNCPVSFIARDHRWPSDKWHHPGGTVQL